MHQRTDLDAASEADLIRARRIELGRFLRERRGHLTPTDADLRLPGQRRVRGLRRAEVAALAGLGLTWYTSLEQGRVENVSPRTLAAVARALCLSAAEREHLFVMAAGSFEELNINDTPPTAEIKAFVQGATFGMAFIVSPRFDVIAFNAQADAFFHFSAHPPPPNLLRLMLADPRMRKQFINPDWRNVVEQMIGHFRLWNGRVVGTAFGQLIEELRAYPDFVTIWESRTVSSPPGERSRLALPDTGVFDIDIRAFTSFACPTYTIVLKTPVQADVLPAPLRAANAGERTGRPASASNGRRAELGAFLRQRRERMRPQDVGLIPIGRRHAKGLRRDEVAGRAGIGTSWYTMLEQGRVENVTQRTLRAVADALQLTHRERLYIERLTVQSFTEYHGFDAGPNPDFLRLVEAFPDGHAHFHDAHFNLLAWNEQADEFYAFSRWERPNLLAIMVRDPSMRTRFVTPTWEESLRRMLAHYRFTHALFDDSESTSMIAALARESPEFRSIISSDSNVVNPATEPGTLLYPGRGLRDVHVMLLTPTGLPTHTLVLKIDAVGGD